MMVPWTAAQHASMHWRPDAITRTGVIQPMWVRQVSPVDMARHTIDPFISSVRGRGPAVSPYPSPEDIAYVAGKLAQRFAEGKSGTVCFGTERIKVKPNQPPSGGIVGTVVAAAQQLARGGTVAIRVGSRTTVVCNNGPGGEPNVQSQPAGQQPTGTTVRPTPMTVEQQKTGGFGMPLLANTRLPNIQRPGNVPQFPYLDYAGAYRGLNYDDNSWARRTLQASLAARYAPHAVSNMNAMTASPIQNAERQAMPALNSRPPMIQQRWPDPAPVYPQQASYSVRPEQRSGR